MLEVICGPMFSGKSELLVARLRVASQQGLRVVAVKPEIAAGAGEIVSRAGARWPAVSLTDGDVLANLTGDHDLVAIDEAHFFSAGLLDAVGEGLAKGGEFVVAGLDLDYRGEPFEVISQLAAGADLITRLTAVCERCGGVATRSQRLIDGRPATRAGPRIIVARDLYEPRCSSCFELAPAREATIC